MTLENCVTPEEYYELEKYYLNPITPIEVLGYAKNHICDAKNMITDIVAEGIAPHSIKDKLKQAYAILDEVQETLYNI